MTFDVATHVLIPPVIPKLTFLLTFLTWLDHYSPLWFVARKGKTTTSPLRPQFAFLSSSDARLRIEPGILYQLTLRINYLANMVHFNPKAP